MSNREQVLQIVSTLPECQVDERSDFPHTVHHNDGISNAVTIADLRESDEILRTKAGQGWAGSTERLFRKIIKM